MAATITVVCPHCNNQMRASAEHIGKRGRCPACRALIEIAPTAEESSHLLRPAQQRAETGGRRSSDATEVTGWLAALLAVVLTAGLYLAVFWPTRQTFLGALFLNRGPVPYVITLFTCWGTAILVLKYLAVRKQRGYAGLELELIPLEIGLQVAPENVEQFLSHLRQLPADQRQSILAQRIQGALEHFKHRTSVPEVQDYLSSQAELDASGVDSGYTLLRAFIWAIPILGFIGTVMGISDAVSGLKQAMPAAEATAGNSGNPGDSGNADIRPADKKTATATGSVGERMMKAMGQVTSGLSTAFDTTLLALVMAVLLLFPTESLRKSEYRMLDRIEEFANESLLRRMSEKEQAEGSSSPAVVRRALEHAFQEHQRWLAQWQAQVAELGQVIGADFEGAVMKLQEQLAASEKGRLQDVRQTAQLISEMQEKLEKSTIDWHSMTADARQNLETANEVAGKLHSALAENSRLLSEAVGQISPATAGSPTGQEELHAAIRELKEEIRNLSARPPVASDPARAPSATQQLERLEPLTHDGETQRSGFFGLFRGRSSKGGD